MAAPFIVTTITATPTWEVRKTDGNVDPAGVPHIVWAGGPLQVVDPYVESDGSKNPVIFGIPAGPGGRSTVQISLVGTCLFPTDYVGTCTVVGSLKNKDGAAYEVLRSAAIPIIPSATEPPIPSPILVTSFTIANPVSNTHCPVPFRYSGDFLWSIKVDGRADLTAQATTRLELGWALAKAPEKPDFVEESLFITGVNLQGVYPVTLMRWFFPDPREFPTDQETFTQTYRRWYIERSVNYIWRWGTPHQAGRPQYDCAEGASSYGVNEYGGTFNLDDWATAKYLTLNCYDLAAITQLACALLISDSGDEFVESRWVFQEPNCYIKPGTLYGRNDQPNCNNPGFMADTPNASPYIAPPSLDDRVPFANHCWVEVSLNVDNTSRTVLDTTHAIGGIPEVGTRTRVDYSNAHRDKEIEPFAEALPDEDKYSGPGNLDNFLSAVPDSKGNCYVNNEFTQQYEISDAKPAGGIQRVGVYEVNSTVPVLSNSSTLSLMAMRPEIKPILELGRNPNPPPPAFNNSSLKTEDLTPLIAALHPEIQHASSIVHLRPGKSHLQVIFKDVPYADGKRARLFLHIETFNDYDHATNAAAQHLSSYSLPLKNIIKPLKPPIGAISLKTRSTISWVRGNSFLRLALDKPHEPTPALVTQLEALARAIDAYLATSTAQPGEHRTPSLALHTPIPETVKVGETFRLALKDTHVNHALAQALSSDMSIVLPRGHADADGVFMFYAKKKGSAEITLLAAHGNTLHPGQEVHMITVVE